MKPYENCRIFGPYTRKDNREIVIVIQGYGKSKIQTTVSYPKFLIENKMGRLLLPDEVIHHKDNNPLNNSYDNLEIMKRSVHSRLHTTKFPLLAQKFNCVFCGNEIELVGEKLRQAKYNRDRGCSGPYCNRSCAGKDSSNLCREINFIKFER